MIHECFFPYLSMHCHSAAGQKRYVSHSLGMVRASTLLTLPSVAAGSAAVPTARRATAFVMMATGRMVLRLELSVVYVFNTKVMFLGDLDCVVLVRQGQVDPCVDVMDDEPNSRKVW